MVYVKIMSFGFKYGRPPANMIFDVSWLKNPKREEKWDENWKVLLGDMREFITTQPKAQALLDAMVEPIILTAENTDTVVGLGCSGGQHRAIAMADALAERLRKRNVDVVVEYHNKL